MRSTQTLLNMSILKQQDVRLFYFIYFILY